MRISMIPADNEGNMLSLKDLRVDGDNIFIKYKSTYNDIPFIETQIFEVDGGKNYAITGDDGTVIFRFDASRLQGLDIAD